MLKGPNGIPGAEPKLITCKANTKHLTLWTLSSPCQIFFSLSFFFYLNRQIFYQWTESYLSESLCHEGSNWQGLFIVPMMSSTPLIQCSFCPGSKSTKCSHEGMLCISHTTDKGLVEPGPCTLQTLDPSSTTFPHPKHHQWGSDNWSTELSWQWQGDRVVRGTLRH